MQRTDKGKKDKEIKITQAALKSFREKGIEGTSIRDIMKKTDLGLGTFYLYFKDKRDLEEEIVLDIMIDLFYEAEENCSGTDPTERYISFIAYIIDYLVKDPVELDLILKNVNWALYAKIENDERFKKADSTLSFVLEKYSALFPIRYSESEQLFILSLTMHIVLSTCKSSLMQNSVLDIEEMKSVLFKIVRKIFG
ncbi:TetR/AcrR family transcriptional regulator [Peptoniphilus catoniae]|uniref:TetR/AcrR family transcriptional regulator n=1 Tax=Peptoniphilus catoniae TaxID=1660341 RepID=UPI0010FE7A9D|nr:TetR/AcrR family transcriptional regulator [Peptoniphilus catoniae]